MSHTTSANLHYAELAATLSEQLDELEDQLDRLRARQAESRRLQLSLTKVRCRIEELATADMSREELERELLTLAASSAWEASTATSADPPPTVGSGASEPRSETDGSTSG